MFIYKLVVPCVLLVLVGLTLAKSEEIDPGLLAEIFGTNYGTPPPPVDPINATSGDEQRVRIEACSLVAPCVLCQGFKYYFTPSGDIFDCQENCGGWTVQMDEYARESNCDISFGDGACLVEFILPDDQNIIRVNKKTCSNAQTLSMAGNQYEGDISDACSGESGPKVTETGYSFITSVATSSQAHGFGTLVYAEDDPYERVEYRGEFKCGQRHGRGYMEWKDGTVYMGDFSHGTKGGQGKMVYTNGDIYEGEWLKEAKDGHGVYVWSDSGFKYIGQFNEGHREGFGEIYGPNSNVGPLFEGTFVDNEKIQGLLKFENGDVYEGPFENNHFHGEGVYNEACGNVYEGTFHHGHKEGTGKFTWNNGVVYEGDFQADLPHGSGTMTWKEGTCISGVFQRGKLTSQEGDCSENQVQGY